MSKISCSYRGKRDGKYQEKRKGKWKILFTILIDSLPSLYCHIFRRLIGDK